MTAWHQCSVSHLVAALAARQVDPWTLFTHFWQRIEQGPDAIWTFRDQAHAAAQARASQSRWEQACRLGPLDGVPFALKDAVDVAGQVTTMASATRRHAAPALQDAPLVQQLLTQGLVLMGRTNLSEFAFSGLGVNPHFGTPALPDAQGRDCAPGGSSSGSARALALGLVPLAVGTDTSGSVRVPSSWNGLVGLRPSAGRYPDGGVFPLAPALDVCGPMARSVEDVRWLDAAMAGQCLPPQPVACPRPRLWVVEGLWTQELDAPVQQAWESGLAVLERAGWVIERRPQPTMEAAMALQAREGMLVSAQAVEVHARLLQDPQALEQLHTPVRERLQQALTLPAGAQERLLQARAELQAQWTQEVGDDTLVVIPTTAGVAPLLQPLLDDPALFAQANLRALRNTLPSSFLGVPSISLPLPVPAHSPQCGLQLSTIAGQDAALLGWAAAIETCWQCP